MGTLLTLDATAPEQLGSGFDATSDIPSRLIDIDSEDLLTDMSNLVKLFLITVEGDVSLYMHLFQTFILRPSPQPGTAIII